MRGLRVLRASVVDSGLKVVLFDIDGTLLTMGGASKAAFIRGLSQAMGKDAIADGYSFVGKTDPQIAREMLRLNRFEGDYERAIDETIRNYLELIPAELPKHPKGKTHPGIPALLDALMARTDVRVALLTGNVIGGARLKLGTFGLTDYFDYALSAFGSDDADRYRLPALALEKARSLLGTGISGADLVIVGDSEHDVLCGKAIGARSVGVATGWVSSDVLRSHGPDALFADFSDTAAAVAAIAGAVAAS